jgi:acyl dehydratase
MDSAAPLPTLAERRFEDYRPGLVVEAGSLAVDEAEIVDFARRYDPQPFHVDPVQAAAGPFGGLVASGWHSAALMMRLLVEHVLPPVASLGSPGIDELRWLQPVRPGDHLTLRVTVLDAQRSRSKPDRGLLRLLLEVFNQRQSLVMTVKALTLLRCRQGEAGA